MQQGGRGAVESGSLSTAGRRLLDNDRSWAGPRGQGRVQASQRRFVQRPADKQANVLATTHASCQQAHRRWAHRANSTRHSLVRRTARSSSSASRSPGGAVAIGGIVRGVAHGRRGLVHVIGRRRSRIASAGIGAEFDQLGTIYRVADA